MSGRILRSRQEDMISVRCFRVGTGEVVYASTINIDYTPDPLPIRPQIYPGPGPYPYDPGDKDIIIIDNSGSNDNTEVGKKVDQTEDAYKEKPASGTEGKGKINLNTIKKPRTDDDQYRYKKPPVTPVEPVKKTSNYNTRKSVTKTSTRSKKTETVVTKPEPQAKPQPRPEPVYKKVEEAKEEPEVKKSSTTSNKKEKKTVIKNTSIKKPAVLKK
jgi:hypothetical protein